MATLEVKEETRERVLGLVQVLRLVDDTATVDDLINRALDKVMPPSPVAVDSRPAVATSEEGAAPLHLDDEDDEASETGGGRARRGSSTPRSVYEEIIVDLLRRNGGAAQTRAIRPAIEKELRLRGHMSAVDDGLVPSGEPRWWNHARFARQDLVNSGILRSDSPHGEWELANHQQGGTAATPEAGSVNGAISRPLSQRTAGDKMTGAKFGLSGDQQILICLHHLARSGGSAPIGDLYTAVEKRMRPCRLSDAGQTSLRFFINKKAVEGGWVHPGHRGQDAWRITDKGRRRAESEPLP